MKLVTWNVNSIRARLDRCLAFLQRIGPDVVCLQELKVPDADFPFDEIHQCGYQAAVFGQRTYNGVAILSRSAIENVVRGLPGDSTDDQARLIAATTVGVKVVSVYVPNGQSVGSEKWAYKLAWLTRLRDWLGSIDRAHPVAVCGDFNVAPEERDVARPEEWVHSVLCHGDARAMMLGLIRSGWVDTMRLHHEGPGPFSWWDYRMLAFPKGNGLRIDHILTTSDLAERCSAVWVDRDERKGKKPSDHAPVIAEFGD